MLYAVIMAGGAGERLWPKSRAKSPKHTLNITGRDTLIGLTIKRARRIVPASRIMIITARGQAALVRRSAPYISRRNIIAEPFGRNTAACIAVAGAVISRRDPGAVMAVMPADHVVKNENRFVSALEKAVDFARGRDALVTLGIKPEHPATGYGYIKVQNSKFKNQNLAGVMRVDSFEEKPDMRAAERYVKSGRYYWNSGIFVWRADAIMSAIKRHMPALHKAAGRIAGHLSAGGDKDAIRDIYRGLDSISIDHGILEKAKNIFVLPTACEWSDLGSWKSIKASRGLVVSLDTSDTTIITSGKHLVAALGLKDIVIVHTDDATLVCDKNRAEDIKALLSIIKKKGLKRYT
ncbi:MAG: hypothetical protein AUJ75_04085 [Candidatus Omnitrophica bacterium CG1_02_49_10]|nr:MAG: hypothetical protein AUJ75_04085 [Candidatus Omnitrophica bacterium CG1_02_49_10]